MEMGVVVSSDWNWRPSVSRAYLIDKPVFHIAFTHCTQSMNKNYVSVDNIVTDSKVSHLAVSFSTPPPLPLSDRCLILETVDELLVRRHIAAPSINIKHFCSTPLQYNFPQLTSGPLLLKIKFSSGRLYKQYRF